MRQIESAKLTDESLRYFLGKTSSTKDVEFRERLNNINHNRINRNDGNDNDDDGDNFYFPSSPTALRSHLQIFYRYQHSRF